MRFAQDGTPADGLLIKRQRPERITKGVLPMEQRKDPRFPIHWRMVFSGALVAGGGTGHQPLGSRLCRGEPSVCPKGHGAGALRPDS